jgi:MutS domain V
VSTSSPTPPQASAPPQAAPPPPTSAPWLAGPWQAYGARLEAAKAALAQLDRRSARIANARAVVFIAGAALAGGVALGQVPREGWWGVVVAFVAYVLLAWRHHRVFAAEERERLRVVLNERGLARLDGRWHTFAEKGERFLEPGHLYTPDLDVFGQGSLFQLINETATRAGEETLAAWLSQPAGAVEVTQRQGAAQELAPMLDWRQTLAYEGRLTARDKANPAAFIAWAEGGPMLDAVRWARPLAWVLPPVTLALYLLGQQGVVPRPLWWAGLLAQLAVVAATRRTFAAMFERVQAGETGFARYERIFRVVEQARFSHPHLLALQQGLQRPGAPPVSEVFAHFSRVHGFASLRLSQFHPVIHLFTLWDFHALFALERWQKEHGASVRAWFEALAALEALACLAGLAHDRPHFTWPTVREGPPTVDVRGVGHPLLEAPVRNDVKLHGPSCALLITGSNMSGKTTLMRAVGLNAVVALAGGPVCADALGVSPLQVLTAMRVRDSLEQGVSYFYAEVRRLKKVLDAAAAVKGQALFLLDEILTGTNTRERHLASREVLKLLLATGAIGAITTHDLSLAELAREYPGRVCNVHFRDHVEDGRMTFDYRLREGVVDTTNALRVMALAGIPISAA